MHKHRQQQEQILQQAIQFTKQTDRNAPHLQALETELEQVQQHRYPCSLLRTNLSTIYAILSQ